MTLTIPLGGRDEGPTGFLRKRASRSLLERRMLYAVTGGVASVDPAAAVKLKNEKKGDLIATNIKDADLNKLFDAVDAASDDPDKAPETTTLDQSVARILGTRAAYVAAVREVAKSDDKALKAGLAWAASLDVDRLARAGDHANTEVQLKRIPTVEKKQDDLEEKVAQLAADVAALKTEVAALKKKPAASTVARGG